MSQNPLSISTSSTISRQNSVNSTDIKSAVRDYIDSLKSDAINEEVEEDLSVNFGIEANSQARPSTTTTTEEPIAETLVSVDQTKKRHLYLPPLSELESYVLENSGENFLNVLPDIAEAIASYVKTYPDQTRLVWQNIKPILKDIRKRNRLHGRNITRPSPPLCPKKPHHWKTVHGEEVVDNYSWLTERENPEVMKHLMDENNYSEMCLAHTKTLQKVLFNEFVSRLDESAESARVTLPDGWIYYSKKESGSEYRLHCRMDKNGFEEVYLDENKLALDPELADPSFFHLGFLRHSPDCKFVAYGIDVSGSERYTVYFLDLETKLTLPDVIYDCYEDFEFSNCGQYAFYVKIDDYERAYQLKRHKMGNLNEEDVVLYEEVDEMFFLTLTKSCNKKYILLNTSAQVTSETRILDLSDPLSRPILVFPRREKVQYTIEHHCFPEEPPESQNYRGYFYVTTNEMSRNIQLFRFPVPSTADWAAKYKDGIKVEDLQSSKEIVIENRDFVLIEGFQVRARHLIVFERSNCMQNIRIVCLDKDGSFDNYHYVSFSEATVYSVWPGSVDEEVADLSKSVLFDTNVLRFTYTSFIQPKQVVDYNMDTRVKTVVHEERVMGPGYDQSLYVSKRLWATGTDGTAIPMSIVYRKDLLGSPSVTAENKAGLGIATSGTGNPTLLHAYGAYGYSLSPIFSTARLSLLDRGFIYCVAHVRGGSEMGNAWYEEGKLSKKPNTFTDFISCAEYLIKEEYTSKEKLAIYGRSAGGLLIGAVVNKRPDLFKSVLTEVPFVDVINTMFDTSIPWTAFEFEEWGNPSDEHIYSVMRNYCPYTNVSNQLYPNMLIVGGMNDPRVAYFEPAKWTAKLREIGKWSEEIPSSSDEGQVKFGNERMLMLKIQEAGHSGSSGQYSYLEDIAFEYAFLISTLGAQFKPVSSGGKDLSLNGVDYDMYWEELEKDNPEDEDEDDYAEEETPIKPSTPLQRFSDYWRRRSIRNKDKKSPTKTNSKEKSSKRASKQHSRASSLSGMKGLFKGLSKPLIEEETPGANNTPDLSVESSRSNPALNEEIRDQVIEEPASIPVITRAPGRSPSSTPGGSKASLRQQLYPYEDESGRVQSSSKVVAMQGHKKISVTNTRKKTTIKKNSGIMRKGKVVIPPKKKHLIESQKVQKGISAKINQKIEESMAVKANSLNKLTILKNVAVAASTQ